MIGWPQLNREMPMLTQLSSPPVRRDGPASGPSLGYVLARRRPFLMFFFLVILSNVAGSIFNFAYNYYLIVQGLLDEEQRRVFWDVASPVYNLVAYPICLGVMFALLVPLVRCRRKLLRAEAVSPGELERCRRRLV